jgi:hypothetical protein
VSYWFFNKSFCIKKQKQKLPSHSLNLRDTVSSPQKVVTRVSHWEVINLPHPLLLMQA